MKAQVNVTTILGVGDPAGSAILDALHSLKHTMVTKVSVGKVIDIELDDGISPTSAKAMLEEAMKNTVHPAMQEFSVVILDESSENKTP